MVDRGMSRSSDPRLSRAQLSSIRSGMGRLVVWCPAMADLRTFGSELRHRREAVGLSLADLASLVHYSKGHLSKVECTDRPPSGALARLCDAALGAGGALVFLAESSRKIDQSRENLAIDDRQAAAPEAPRVPAALAAAAENDRTLAIFRTLFREYIYLDQSTGAALALPGLIAHAVTLRSLARHATEKYRTQLLHLAALYAGLAGKTAYEMGNQHDAERWGSLSISISDTIATAGLAAYTRILGAELALGCEDSGRAIAVSEQAQGDHTATKRLQGMVIVREARAYAQLGDHDQCERALDRAGARLHDTESIVLDDVIVDHLDGAHIHRMWTAWCLLDLGEPARAARLLDEEVGRIPPACSRPATSFGLRRALAHATAGEVDHACELTVPLLDNFSLLDSTLNRRDLLALARTLRRWRSHAQARELSAQLRTVVRSVRSPSLG